MQKEEFVPSFWTQHVQCKVRSPSDEISFRRCCCLEEDEQVSTLGTTSTRLNSSRRGKAPAVPCGLGARSKLAFVTARAGAFGPRNTARNLSLSRSRGGDTYNGRVRGSEACGRRRSRSSLLTLTSARKRLAKLISPGSVWW